MFDHLHKMNEADLATYSSELLNFLRTKSIDNRLVAISIKVTPSIISRLGKRKDNGKYPRKENTIERLIAIHKNNGVIYKGKKSNNSYNFIIVDPLKNNPELRELATKLACNIVDVSTSFNKKNEPHKKIIKAELLRKYRKTENRERIILITGAGVSHSATKGVIPLTKDAIEIIKKEVVTKPDSDKKGIPERIINNELDYISLSTNLERDEFETQLMAYSKFDQDGVLDGLREMCKPKHIPNLEYEILAHLVKNRAIDAILDFNIDELFNIKLMEELDEEDFKAIYSDGHCPNTYNDLLVGKRLKQTIVIKPHGIITHSNSLRFSRERPSKIPIKIRTLISDILTAKLPDSISTEQEYLKVNFIIIGFGMKSPLMLESIKRYLDLEKNVKRGEDPHFWFFDTKKNLKEFNLSLEPKHQKILADNSTFFQVNDKVSLSDYLEALWGFVENSFTEKKYKIKGIERHLLLNKIFELSKEEIKVQKIPDYRYWHDRTLVELFLNILSSNGLLLSKHLLETRMGLYLTKLNELEQTNPSSLSVMCKKLGLILYKNFVKNAFMLKRPNLFYDENFVSDLYDSLTNKILSPKIKNALSTNEEKREIIISLGNKIKNRNSLKISPKFINPHRDIFPSIKEDCILTTSLAWRYQYRRILDEKNWDLMLAVSEKGRILPKTKTEVEKMFKGKKLELVLSSFDIPNNFYDFDPKREDILIVNNSNILLSDCIQTLPWWLHNQHMVIFLKRKKNHHQYDKHRNKWEILDSFYYESRMLSPTVNPVMITEPEDKDELLNIFANYWYRAKVYTEEIKNPKSKLRSIPIIPNKVFLNGQVEDLLSKYKL